MKQRVLITGAQGILASYVIKNLSKDFVLFPFAKEALDITNTDAIEKAFSSSKPHIVIHVAAKTNVDACEKHPEQAFAVNSDGTKYIAEACKKYHAKLIYVSTAAVFDGKKEVFFENDTPHPSNIYGKSKLKGEEYVQSILAPEEHIILRIAWLIGGGKEEKKFISYIIHQIETSPMLSVVDDKKGTIAYAKEVAEFIHSLIEKDLSGIYHFGSQGVCTRVDIAKKLVSLIGKNITIHPVPSSYFQSAFSAPRPDQEVLGSIKTKFSKTWEESLESYYSLELAATS